MVFDNLFYFWLSAAISVFVFALNLFTLKRIRFFRYFDVIRALMWSSVVLFLGMALSGVKISWNKPFPIKEKLEIIFALDVSLSSLARDVIVEKDGRLRKISRLDFEKEQVENIIGILGGDAAGIIIFADKAVPLQIILSREDYGNTLIRNLRYIDKNFVRYAVSQGTDYGNLILAALEQFGKETSRKKILFVLTDGEPQGEEEKLQKNLGEAIKQFSARKDIGVYLIGIGNSREPSPIPKVEDENGNVKEYYIETYGKAKGQQILTRPNPEFLAHLANMTNGYYFHAASSQDLKNIFKTSLEKERRIIGFQEKTETHDLTPYLLFSSLILLFAIPFIKAV